MLRTNYQRHSPTRNCTSDISSRRLLSASQRNQEADYCQLSYVPKKGGSGSLASQNRSCSRGYPSVDQIATGGPEQNRDCGDHREGVAHAGRQCTEA